MVLVHEPFARIAEVQCDTLGAKNSAIVVYKQDAPAFESDEDLVRKANSVANQILVAVRG